MRRRLPRSMHGRAIIGLIALYGLCLQAFLGGLMPMPRDASGGVICAEHGGSGAPADDGLPCPQHACCTAVHVADPAGPAPIPSEIVVWPASDATASSSWDRVASTGARAPPNRTASPRGPPAA